MAANQTGFDNVPIVTTLEETMRSLIPFIPAEMYALLLAVAGLVLVVGAKRLACAIVVAVLASLFMPVVLEPLLDTLPLWMLVLMVTLMLAGILREIIALLLGRHATDEMVGTLAADAVRATLAAPFRLLGWLRRLLLKR